MTDQRRERAEKRGRRGEMLAALWLQVQGYQILARRMKSPVGEVDLIARRGRLLAFVEVKVRSSRAKALAALSAKQQQRIERAASYFLSQRPKLADHNIRFDVIVIGGGLPKHIRDAWRPEA